MGITHLFQTAQRYNIHPKQQTKRTKKIPLWTRRKKKESGSAFPSAKAHTTDSTCSVPLRDARNPNWLTKHWMGTMFSQPSNNPNAQIIRKAHTILSMCLSSVIAIRTYRYLPWLSSFLSLSSVSKVCICSPWLRSHRNRIRWLVSFLHTERTPSLFQICWIYEFRFWWYRNDSVRPNIQI